MSEVLINGQENPREIHPSKDPRPVYDAERRVVYTWCRKCGIRLTLQFEKDDGTLLTIQEAEESLKKLGEQRGWECPGYHVEIGEFGWYFRLDEALQVFKQAMGQPGG